MRADVSGAMAAWMTSCGGFSSLLRLSDRINEDVEA
jgi:hypothetical protein